jgi:hypothetical protein
MSSRFSITPSAMGNNVIRARLGTSTSSVHFTATGAPAETTLAWVGGAAGSPRTWTVVSNWSPATAPSPSDRLFVPWVAAWNAPQLTGTTAVRLSSPEKA